MFRHRFRRQIATVASGGDPLGVTHDPTDGLVRVRAGNYIGDHDEVIALG